MTPASLRSTLSEIVPATAPVRSSGTGTLAHSKSAALAQGMKLRLDAAEELVGEPHSSAAGSSAVRARVSALAHRRRQ